MVKMRLLHTLLLYCLSFNMYAQIKPVFNVSGPEIANLGQYGSVPVGHFTGVPDIFIPLYTVQVGSYSLPISVNYHLASTKPTTAPGILGAAWSLKAGGYIARNVRGRYDEIMDSKGVGHGYYAHADKIKTLDNANIAKHMENYLEADFKNKNNPDWYELAADEFSFNFCGYSGTFYYAGNGDWAVISDQNIKVEFNPSEDFITLNDVSKRIPVTNWNWSSNNQRYFGHFTLVTPDGFRYEFGGIDAMEFSVPYYGRNCNDLVVSTWLLSKITTIDHRIIHFTYDTSPIMANIKYVPQYSEIYQDKANKDIFTQIGRNGFTGFLQYPVILKSITTENEAITLDYQKDYSYPTNFGQHSNCLYWSDSSKFRKDLFLSPDDNPAKQFLTLFKLDTFTKDMSMEQAIANSLKHFYLHRIAIKNLHGGYSKSIYFGYKFDKENLLSLITFREGIPDLIKRDILSPHPDQSVTVFDIPSLPDTTNVPEYNFYYFPQDKGQVAYGLANVDSWGYYSGGISSITDSASFKLKVPNLTYTRRGILRAICYPTGGKSFFTYELHTYSKQVSNINRTTIRKRTGIAGGLRIKTIKNVDKDNKVLNFKQYHYTENIGDAPTNSSGISKGDPCVLFSTKIGEYTYVQASEGGLFPDVTNFNSPDVGYSCVIEETQDSVGISQGYVKYRYSNYDSDIYGQSHFDESYDLGINTPPGSPLASFNSRSFERGKLLSKETYSKDGILLRTEKYSYKRVNETILPYVSQNVSWYSVVTGLNPPINKAYSLTGYVGKVYLCAYLPQQKTITEFYESAPYEEKSLYTYNDDKLLITDSTLCSDGGWLINRFFYPADNKRYNWMVNKHIISPIVSTLTSQNDKGHYLEYVYESKNDIPYVKSKKTGRNATSWKEEYSVLSTDDYGNPVEIMQDGRTSVFLWGERGLRMIARFDNVTSRQMHIVMGNSPKSFSNYSLEKIDYAPIFQARRMLPNTLSTIYQYNGNLLLKALTDNSGFTTYFKYDFLDRLREKYYFDSNGKQIIESYDYHYYRK